MQNSICKELIHKDVLQRIQDEFCQVMGVTAYCLDSEYHSITVPSGVAENGNLFQEEKYADCIETALERVKEDSLEEQAVEELEDGGQIAAVAVRIEGMTVIYWVVLDLSKRGNLHFYHMLDLIRDVSLTMFTQSMNYVSAESESRKSRSAEAAMSRSLRAVEATTGIVQLLDSDEQIELVMDKWLKILAEYLQVDSAELFQLNADGSAMDVICEWCKEGIISFFDKTSQVDTCSFLRAGKTIIISADNQQNEYKKELELIGMKAVMIFPVIKTGNGNRTVVSLNHRVERHVWNMAEIKFTADAVKILESILTRWQQKAFLANSNAAFETVLDNMSCSIYVADSITGNKLFANLKAECVFAKELKNGTFAEFLTQGVSKDREDGNSEIFHEGRQRWYNLIYKKIAWMNGNPATLYLLYDITDKKLYQKRIEQQAFTDYLTGLYNRMCCERDLARYIDETEKNGGNGALLYLDLDDFKHINDGLGHQYGDVLLKDVAIYLQQVEGIQNTCYRVGGDEFIVIVPPKSYTRLANIVEDIKQIFNRPWFLKNTDYYCTMSMGVVSYPNDGNSVADLIKKADIAMYEAKKMGKNRAAYYSQGTDSASSRRLDMEKNMRDAALNGYQEFEVYYQPIIDTTNNQAVCVGQKHCYVGIVRIWVLFLRQNLFHWQNIWD